MNLSDWFCSLTCESGLEGIRWRRPIGFSACLWCVVGDVGGWFWKYGVDPGFWSGLLFGDAVFRISIRLTQNTQCFSDSFLGPPLAGSGGLDWGLGSVRIGAERRCDELESLILAQSERWRHA